MNAGVFNDSKMNDAVWKFRSFEEPSLRYGEDGSTPSAQGGWNLVRDERFAQLVSAEILAAGGILTGASGETTATVTADYGISVVGIRYESPDAAADAATNGTGMDGWTFWSAATAYGSGTLAELAELEPAPS